ncbi:hypothetical protein C8R44DRAFT_236845 [Mycena epipterygia]|nr:hypothetical protein C8R44DRAFT_236845 [Mycena epipterygia]
MPRPIFSSPRFFLLLALTLQSVSGTQAFFHHNNDDDDDDDHDRTTRIIVGAVVCGVTLILILIAYLIFRRRRRRARELAMGGLPMQPMSVVNGAPGGFAPATFAPPPGAPGYWASPGNDNNAPAPNAFSQPPPRPPREMV